MKTFISEFVDKVSHEDPFLVFIYGHVYVDSLVTVLLGSSLLTPSELDTKRMRFGEKIRLCTAMGLIHRDVGPALKKMAEIRNAFAHEIWPTFSAKDQRDFLNVLRQTPRLRRALLNAKPNFSGIPASIWVLWIYLFGQIVRVTSKKATLIQFWENVVDVNGVKAESLPLPLGPRLKGGNNTYDTFAIISPK
jgi:hypothetical protein